MTQQQIEAALTILQSQHYPREKARGWAIRFGVALLELKREKKKWQRLAQRRAECLRMIEKELKKG